MNMVEKVARAISPIMWDGQLLPMMDPKQIERYRDEALATARIAIGAMMEPTLRMAEDGAEQVPSCLAEPKNAAEVWHAMIYAALAEEKQPEPA